MPFGLCNSTPTFQRVIEIALNGLQWLTCLIYIDDIIVFGNSVQQNMEGVQEVLQRLAADGLKLKPEKCALLHKEAGFLGHVVNKDGIKPDPNNISKILACATPTIATEVRQLLGMGSYYRRFVQNFSQMVQPLINLTKKEVSFEWKCISKFEEDTH